MKIYKSNTGSFYLVEDLIYGDTEVMRLIRIEGKRDSERSFARRDLNGTLFDVEHSEIDDLNLIEIPKETLLKFCRERGLLSTVLNTWTLKNEDNSLTYNSKRPFRFFEDSLVVRRSMFGKVKPYMLVNKEEKERYCKIHFIPLEEGSTLSMDYMDALKLPLYKILEKPNLEYRVYFSLKDKSKQITKHLGL